MYAGVLISEMSTNCTINETVVQLVLPTTVSIVHLKQHAQRDATCHDPASQFANYLWCFNEFVLPLLHSTVVF